MIASLPKEGDLVVTLPGWPGMIRMTGRVIESRVTLWGDAVVPAVRLHLTDGNTTGWVRAEHVALVGSMAAERARCPRCHAPAGGDYDGEADACFRCGRGFGAGAAAWGRCALACVLMVGFVVACYLMITARKAS